MKRSLEESGNEYTDLSWERNHKDITTTRGNEASVLGGKNRQTQQT